MEEQSSEGETKRIEGICCDRGGEGGRVAHTRKRYFSIVGETWRNDVGNNDVLSCE